MYSLPVVTREAEPQEDDGTARTWIAVDPKVYPGIPMLQGWRQVPEETVVAAGGDFFLVFLCFVVSTCQALLADPGRPLSDKLSGRQGLVSFPNILNQKNDKVYYKYNKKIYKQCS